MKKLTDYMAEELSAAFEKAGYDSSYGKVGVSNRPDLCEYQCNGAMAGIGVYQLGTSGTDVKIQEEAPSYLDDTADTKENEDSAVDAGTSLVEAEMKDEGTDTEKEMTGVENTVLADSEDAEQTTVQSVDENGAAQSAVSTESVSTSANAEAAPKLSFTISPSSTVRSFNCP